MSPPSAVQAHLNRLVAADRRRLVLDHRRVERELLRVYPDRPREVVLLHIAAREGIAAELAQGTGTELPRMLFKRLTARLCGRAGIARHHAEWTVRTWASALDRTLALPPGRARKTTRKSASTLRRAPAVLIGHRKPVTGIVFSGKRLVTSSLDRSLRSWQTDNGALRHSQLVAHRDWIRAITWCGGLLASGGDDGRVKLWDLEAWEPRNQLSPGAPVVDLAAGDGWLAAARADGLVRVWDRETWVLTSELGAYTDPRLGVHPEGPVIVHRDGVHLPGAELHEHGGQDVSVGERVVIATPTSVVELHPDSGEVVSEWEPEAGPPEHVAAHHDTVAVSTRSGHLEIWREGRRLHGRAARVPICHLAFVDEVLGIGHTDGRVDFLEVR